MNEVLEVLKAMKWDIENRSALMCQHCERRYDDDICDACFKKRQLGSVNDVIKLLEAKTK